MRNEFLSVEKACAEFRTPLWEILATPLNSGIILAKIVTIILKVMPAY